MKKYLFITFLFLMTSINVEAQTRKYVTYTVKKGETLRSIARDFDVSPRDLFDLNPDVDRKPSENTVILIPILETVETEKTDTYTVLPKETIYGISLKYKTTVAEIIRLNPILAKEELKDGQQIKVPLLKEDSKKEIVNETPNTIDKLHIVEKGDTVYNLTKKYNITEEVLMRQNPFLKDEGLRIGQQLLISKASTNHTENKKLNLSKSVVHKIQQGETLYSVSRLYQISEEELIAQNPILKEGFKLGVELHIKTDQKAVANVLQPKQVAKTAPNINFKTGKTVNLVLMLPFKLNEIEDVGIHFNNSSSLLNIATEFYQGAEIAIDSLRNQGAKINLKSFDSEQNEEKIISILKTNNLSNTDVFIGPLFLSSAQKLAKNITNGYVIAPMSSKDHNKYSEANLIKTGVKNELLEESMLQYMKRTYAGQNVIVIGDNKPGTNNEADRIAWKLKSTGAISNVTVLKPTGGYITKQRFESVINNSKKNWVLLVGDDNIVITDAVNTYGITDKSIDIRMFSLKYEGNIEKANNFYLARLNFTFPSAEYSDFNNINVQSFVKQYKDKYIASPSSNAIRGFDVTYDTLVRMLLNGVNNESIDNYIFDRIAARFNYKPTSIAGFENNGIFILKYEPDLSLTIIE